MIVKLYQPVLYNWLLFAEDLDDPLVWDRFLPCHTVQSQRWKFDQTVKEFAGQEVKLAPCRSFLKRGVSVFEYDWNTDESDILDHSMRVAEALGVDLMLGALTSSTGKNAA